MAWIDNFPNQTLKWFLEGFKTVLLALGQIDSITRERDRIKKGFMFHVELSRVGVLSSFT